MIDRLRDLGEMLSSKKTDAGNLLSETDLANTRLIIQSMIFDFANTNQHIFEKIYTPVLNEMESEGELGDVSSHFIRMQGAYYDGSYGEYHKEFVDAYRDTANRLRVSSSSLGRSIVQMRQRESIVRGIINEEIRNYVQRESGDELSLDDLLEGQRDDNASRAG